MTLKTYDLVTPDAQIALQDFKMEVLGALTQSYDPVLEGLGISETDNSLKTTYEINLSAAGLVEFDGDPRFRKLGEKGVSLTPRTFNDGIRELASKIESSEWAKRGWADEPAVMAEVIRTFPEKLIAQVIEANATCYDGVAFFHASHPVNVFDTSLGTFGNTTASASLSLATLKAAKVAMRKMKAANGEPLGMEPRYLIVPPDLAEVAKDLLENDMIIDSPDGGATFGAQTNRHKGTLKLIVSNHLTSATTWYLLGEKLGQKPWVVTKRAAPEFILRDKSSDLYATTYEVSLQVKLEAEAALLMPHCLHRFTA